MAHKNKMPQTTNLKHTNSFPPEADGDFEVVSDAEISEWQKKLNERFGIGQGKMRVVAEPIEAV